MDVVPTIALADLSEEQIRAYILADNKLAENAGWDKEILAIEFQHLMSLDGLDLDISVTGFEIPEIDIILEEATQSDQEDVATPQIDRYQPAVSRFGDLWRLRDHRMFCGNSVHEESFETLMGTERAHAIFTDPPFNVRIDGHATGNGSIRHREFAMAAVELTEEEFRKFLDLCISHLVRYGRPESVHYICMNCRYIEMLLAEEGKHFDELFQPLCVGQGQWRDGQFLPLSA